MWLWWFLDELGNRQNDPKAQTSDIVTSALTVRLCTYVEY